MIAIFLVAFVALLSFGIPIAIGLGGSAMHMFLQPGYRAHDPVPADRSRRNGIVSASMAIPLFVFPRNLMNKGGLTQSVHLRQAGDRAHRGGLGHATIIACAIFAAISGAAVATAVAIGMIMIPAMKQEGFDEDLGAAITATASCMGPIIPAEHSVYSLSWSYANVSIGALFSAV